MFRECLLGRGGLGFGTPQTLRLFWFVVSWGPVRALLCFEGSCAPLNHPHNLNPNPNPPPANKNRKPEPEPELQPEPEPKPEPEPPPQPQARTRTQNQNRHAGGLGGGKDRMKPPGRKSVFWALEACSACCVLLLGARNLS